MDIRDKIRIWQESIGTVIKGKPDVIKLAIVALLAKGHILIEDIPGVGKTTLAHSLAKSINCSFQRIQFTSDLLPSDILGVTIFDQSKSEFIFKPGPIFANVVLADEINRTTPKTQSCLLEAMNDGQVSVDRRTYILPQPFFVIATQNPIEYHGTFPLPESQLDRFLMRLRMGYPSEEEEKHILRGNPLGAPLQELKPVLSTEEVEQLQKMVGSVVVKETIIDYLMDIITATRTTELLGLGVSPRGNISLYRAAQAYALVEGRDYCIPDDVKNLAISVLSHRILVNTRLTRGARRSYDAENVIREIVDSIPVPL